ncbi:DeoR/GlpR family DNA-binding transcription regulator [Peribacillus sp. SCS-37]|uniref:DeoR/GlpR family DNA-binding transcription regulator n=1 Tax=Paraperibacillus esterisolvens TaxID=3115296 RepID=UPI003906416F
MFSEERKKRILDLLEKNERIQAKELASTLGVSIDSVRRYLTSLEKDGLLRRTHGGAVRSGLPASRETEPDSGRDSSIRTIARNAASYIKENDTIFIGSSELCQAIAEFLTEKHITVVTNSAAAAARLSEEDHIDCYVLGGRVKKDGEISDPLLVSVLQNYHFDISFISGSGLTRSGLSTRDPETASVLRAAAKQARMTVCLIEGRSLGTASFVNVLPLSEIDKIITAGKAPEPWKEHLRDNGAAIIDAE